MKTLNELTQETNHATHLLYCINYWDGPLTGLIKWNNEIAYFNKYDEIVHKTPLTDEEKEEYKEICKQNNYEFREDDCFDYETEFLYKVYRLPIQELTKILVRKYFFELFVGTHWVYDENNQRGMGAEIGNQGEIISRNNLKPYFLHGIYYKIIQKFLPKNEIDISKYEIIGEFKI